MKKKIFNVIWKVLLLSIVYIVASALMSQVLPLSNDMMAAMSEADRAIFFPLYFLQTIIYMSVIHLTLVTLRQSGWRLLLGCWMAVFGLFSLLNNIELYWFNESFPLFSYLDVTKLVIKDLISYGVTVLMGVWLVKGFSREPVAAQVRFDAGEKGWKVILFCVTYPLIYYCFGFIPWLFFPEIREFYASWAISSEPIYVLLLFNIPRAMLWLLFSLPILFGVRTRCQAYWLLPLLMVMGTAFAVIVPSAVMPGQVRLAHFIELFLSMALIGIYMVRLFVKDILIIRSE